MWEHQNALPGITCDCPLDCKIKPVKHKGNQLLRCVRITDAEAESLKLWLPEQRTDSLEKTLILRKHWIKKRSGLERRRRFYSFIYSMDMISGRLWEMLRDREALWAAVQWLAESYMALWLNNNKISVNKMDLPGSWLCLKMLEE